MSDGQTIIQYGNIALYHCTMRRFDQRPVEDSAGVSLKNWRFLVVVTGYLNGLPGTFPYSLPVDNGAASIHQRIRWQLAPRMTFRMAVGCVTEDINSGQTILFATSMNGVSQASLISTGNGLTGYDVNDGPKCLQFDVTRASGNNVFHVEAVFEVHRVQCTDSDTAASNTRGVLSHRWASIDSIDVNKRTTRTYHGILEIATSYWSPHLFRHLVVPPIQNGMRRDHMDFAATEDGKRLQYTITDIDVAQAAPYPAQTWAIEHTVISLNQDSMKVTEQVSVTLTGDHNVDKTQLMILGLYVISAKVLGGPPLAANDPEAVGGVFWNDLTISDFPGDVNVVRLSGSCWRRARQAILPPPNGGDGQPTNVALASRYGAFKPIDINMLPKFVTTYDPNISAGGNPRDTMKYEGPVSLTGIFRCYLQNPCNDSHGINATTFDNDGNVTSTNQIASYSNDEILANQYYNLPAATITAVQTATIPDTFPDRYSASHKTSMYTFYEMESKYSSHTLRVACPIALPAYTYVSGGGIIDTRDGTACPKIGPTQTRRKVMIVAERVGDWPEFPNAEIVDAGLAASITAGAVANIQQTLLRKKLLAKTVTTSINGEKLYSARYMAIYALSRDPNSAEAVKIGVNKWQNDGDTATTPTLTSSAQEAYGSLGDNNISVPGGIYYQ